MAAFASKEADLDKAETMVEQHVELEKLGQPTKLLRMELIWGPGYVKLTQKTAIGNLAKEFEIPTMEIPTKSLPLNANDYVEVKNEEMSPELQ